VNAAPFLHLGGADLELEAAFALAEELVECAAGRRLDVVGRYVVPPADGPPTRRFQTSHVDFGLPLTPARPLDVASYTALLVPLDAPTEGATTRLVPLRELLGQRSWPERAELVHRLEQYGRTHGAWDDNAGYTEGSLARLVEAADGARPVLPSVREPGFRCGMEFDDAHGEAAFFAARGLDVAAVAVEVRLAPGDLLVFDNHAVAHGRRGRRLPGELHQRFFGLLEAGVDEQLRMRDRLLDRFPSPGSVGARVEGRSVEQRRTA
jgi:hypothetical protein